MSEEISYSNYLYQGQVYSPAFSDPPSPSSPMSTTSDTSSSTQSDSSCCPVEQIAIVSSHPPQPLLKGTSDMLPINRGEKLANNLQEQETCHSSLKLDSNISHSQPKCESSAMSREDMDTCTRNLSHNQQLTAAVQNTSRPKFPTKYHEMLQPLTPVTTLPVEEVVRRPLPMKTHVTEHDVQLQDQFHLLVNRATSSPPLSPKVIDNHDKTQEQQRDRTNSVENFLMRHSENIDVNQYNSDGKTALQQCCLAGNVPLVKLLVRFGANVKLTTREGFSVLHIAAFSGQSDMLTFVMGLNNSR